MLKKILLIALSLYAAAALAAVDVNQANAAELDGVKGIGPGLSTKILEERQRGEFKDWNDFIGRVGGVGEKTAARLSAEGLTVGGKKFNAAAAAKAKAKAGKSAESEKAEKAGKKDKDAQTTANPGTADQARKEVSASAGQPPANAVPASSAADTATKK